MASLYRDTCLPCLPWRHLDVVGRAVARTRTHETGCRSACSWVASRFSASDEAERGNGKGNLVYDVRPALRYKPLPDLFAGSLPKKTAAPEAVPLTVPAAAPEEVKEQPEKEKKEGTLPVVCGAVHEGDIHLVILKWQGQTATCAAGEWWNGWYIAYVNRQAAGLQRDGRVFEIPL